MFIGDRSNADAVGSKSTFRSLAEINDLAVSALDLAAYSPNFDNQLLSSTPAHDIRSAVESLVILLESLDLRKLLKKQGIIGRFTGADVEARLGFELASKKVSEQFQQLARLANSAERIRDLLLSAARELGDEQVRIAQVLHDGQALLTRSTAVEPALITRFERRLSNIATMETANALTIRQIAISVELLSSLLDRCTDVQTLLVPVWQRDALAVIHGGSINSRGSVATSFIETHRRLIALLKKVLPE
ncbi:hypothetical protein [Rhizobium sp. S163]|uniref:hypothetical protein n=1 Tax=Rhizobium sp. S163 TaxID=3055039 RepID=UPI0025AA2F96|nr:hypothetical protein [Rhizobium sp. S163]MDM9648890.1 hypothetical protein [Rhizobium sp. S163]